MENIQAVSKKYWYVILNAAALTFIYYVPALSHLLNIPIYLFEPMRIMLFLSIIFSSKRNSYLIALTLPLFSFIVSAHPSAIKSILIAVELGINVFLYYFFIEMLKNNFTAAFFSIILSKVLYYLLKFALIYFLLIDGNLISTPLYLQIVVTIMLSFIVFGADLLKGNK